MSEETAKYQVGNDEEAHTPEFPESKIRAVAERLWWHKASKKTIAKYNYLTVEKVEKLQKSLKYQNYVEKIMFERHSPEDFEKWIARHKRDDEKHGRDEMQGFAEHMGLDPEVVKGMVERVRQAHDDQDLDRAKVNLLWKREICDDEILKEFHPSLADNIKEHLEWLRETEKRKPNLKEEI